MTSSSSYGIEGLGGLRYSERSAGSAVRQSDPTAGVGLVWPVFVIFAFFAVKWSGGRAGARRSQGRNRLRAGSYLMPSLLCALCVLCGGDIPSVPASFSSLPSVVRIGTVRRRAATLRQAFSSSSSFLTRKVRVEFSFTVPEMRARASWFSRCFWRKRFNGRAPYTGS